MIERFFAFLLCCCAVCLPSAGFAQTTAPDEFTAAADGELFLFPPQTPAELVRAVQITQQMRRPADARRYLQQLLATATTTDDLTALRREFGIGTFLDLYSDPNLQPEAQELLNAVGAAAGEAVPSGFRIGQLLEQPGTTTRERADAIMEIVSARDAAVPVLLEAEPETDAGRLATTILEAWARPLRYGLLNELESADDATRIRILRLLYRTADQELIPVLLRWQFGPDVSPAVVDQAEVTIRALAGDRPVPETAAAAANRIANRIRALVAEAGSRFGMQDVPGELASIPDAADRQRLLDSATRLADSLLAIAPQDPRSVILSEVVRLASEETDAAPAAGGIDAEQRNAVLATALELRNSKAAYGALRQWAAESESDPSAVPETGVLTQALADPDARVRALAAGLLLVSGRRAASPILLQQQRDALERGSVRPEAVVVDSRETQSAELVAVLRDGGFTAASSGTSAAGFDVAVGQLQCELILLQANCQQWPLSLAVANLRADGRTAETPIIVYGSRRARDAVRRLATRYPGIWFLEEPVTRLTLFERLSLYRVPDPLLDTDARLELKSRTVALPTTAAGPE